VRAALALIVLLAAAWVGPVAAHAERESASAPRLRPTYDAGGRRDPFNPLVEGGKIIAQTGTRSHSAFQPELYGIVWDPAGHSLALINEGEVRVGDEVAGYRVAEIRKDAVVLSNGGEPLVLTISFEPESAGPRPTKGERE
jgi:hypothetical protein